MQIKVTNDGDGCAHVSVLNEAGGEVAAAQVNANEEVVLTSDGNVTASEVAPAGTSEGGGEAPAEEPVQANPDPVSEGGEQATTDAGGVPGDSSEPGARPGEGQPASDQVGGAAPEGVPGEPGEPAPEPGQEPQPGPGGQAL